MDNVEDLALEFCCKVRDLISTYLGVLLGAPFKFMAAWDGVEEMFRKGLALWKR